MPPASDQQPQPQVEALERAGCHRAFTETAGGDPSRPRPAPGPAPPPATPWSSRDWTASAAPCGI